MQLEVKLKLLRQAHAYSQEEVGFYCQISQAAYCKYESGKSIPTIVRLELLADLYKLKLSDFFDLSVEQILEKTRKTHYVKLE